MILLITILMVATVMDLRTDRIPNAFILISLMTGLIYQYHTSGIQTTLISMMGILFSILLLFPTFMIRALGAGDIKLFGVIGCFLTAGQCQKIAILIFIALILGVMQAVLLSCVKHRYQRKIHFTIPILLSTLLYTGGLY